MCLMAATSALQGGGMMARIEGVDPAIAEPAVKAVLDAQARKWGGPLLNHLIYARRPTIFRGARAMWAGIGGSGLIDERLQALINRPLASHNGGSKCTTITCRLQPRYTSEQLTLPRATGLTFVAVTYR